MKRILIFSLAYYPLVGGAEVAIKEITDRIAPGDIEFHLVTLRFDSSWPKEERIGNVRVHRIGFGRRSASVAATFSPLFYVSKMLFIPLAARYGARLHRTHRFDACWAMMSYMVLPVLFMRIFGARLPYAVTLQEGDTFEHVFKRARLRPLVPLLRLGFRRASVMQTISTYLGAWARALRFEGPVEVIPNGVDTAAFARALSPAQRGSLRAHLGVTNAETLLVTASRLVPKNAVDAVIRALSLLPPRVHFLVLGDGPELPRLTELAAELEVLPRVHFAGAVPHTDLPALLHASDMFVRPSRSEGMGNAFIEAFAAGLPVIATQVGGIVDFLFDRERNPDRRPTGFAVDVDSPDDIARAVEEILADPEAAARAAENAAALARERYDWNMLARQMRERVFERVVRAPRGTPCPDGATKAPASGTQRPHGVAHHDIS